MLDDRPAACAEPTCDRPVAARGYCRRHYQVHRNSGVLRRLTYEAKRCSYVDDAGRCPNKVHARDVCQTHYSWIRNRGSLVPPTRKMPPHGGPTRYMTHKCRCDECRAWHRDYARALRKQNREAQKAARQMRVGVAMCCGCKERPSGNSSGYCASCATGRKYKMSAAEYEALLAIQDGVCAICGGGEKVERNGRRRRLCIDHCHRSGEVRGLLCGTCNSGLGQFYDNPDLLQAAILYLRRSA